MENQRMVKYLRDDFPVSKARMIFFVTIAELVK